MSITVEAAEKEMQQLTKKIAELDNLRSRYSALETFVNLGKQLSSTNGAAPVEAQLHPLKPRHRGGRNPTADMAEKALRDRGPLTLRELLPAVVAVGWKGSGNTKKDEKAIYAAIYRKTDRFEQSTDGKWKAKIK